MRLKLLVVLAVGACNDRPPEPLDGSIPDDGPQVPDVDAGSPACVAEGFSRGAASPAFGTLQGAGLSGTIFLGGAFAYMETTPGTISDPTKQLLLVIDTALSGDPTTFQNLDARKRDGGGDQVLRGHARGRARNLSEQQDLRLPRVLRDAPHAGRGLRRCERADDVPARMRPHRAGRRPHACPSRRRAAGRPPPRQTVSVARRASSDPGPWR